MRTSATTASSRPTRNRGTDNTYSVFVVELDDVVPRRHPKLPNLYVGLTKESPDMRVAQMRQGNGSSWVYGHIVGLRSDLASGLEPTSHDQAKQQKKALSAQLKQRGFTVNLDSRVWSVYVVQLDENQQSDTGEGWVYVGETSRTPEERLRQHLSGARNAKTRLFSPVVHKHGQHLRWDLMRGLPTLYSQADSKLAEAELAEGLRKQGYVVEGGH